jgi:uncharacterized repeat protein (TIGR03803 family)
MRPPLNGFAVFCLVLCSPPAGAAHAASLVTIYNFDDLALKHPPGGGPLGRIVVTADGTVFGTTPANLQPDAGTVYELSPPAAGGTAWTHQVLWFFDATGLGADPQGGLTRGGNGVLYGTTAYDTQNAVGCGHVFSVQSVDGKAQVSSIDTLGAAACIPYDPVAVGADGSLYATTSSSSGHFGAIFRLVPPVPGSAAWTEQVLYDFQGLEDGYYPSTPVLVSRSGAIYGTSIGSANAPPTMEPVYQLTPPAAGQTSWTFELIWRFPTLQCAEVTGAMIEDAAGSLIFTCQQGENGGPNQYGSVFRLNPPARTGTAWTLDTLWNFSNGTDGAYPNTGLVADARGDLYGTTLQGDGTVFELNPPAAGQSSWTERTLWTFTGGDGVQPRTPLVFGPRGTLFGTTSFGGDYDTGTVFELTP